LTYIVNDNCIRRQPTPYELSTELERKRQATGLSVQQKLAKLRMTTLMAQSQSRSCALEMAAHAFDWPSRHCAYAKLCIRAGRIAQHRNHIRSSVFHPWLGGFTPIPLSPNAEVTAASFFNRKP
jgi:hypothetical protein